MGCSEEPIDINNVDIQICHNIMFFIYLYENQIFPYIRERNCYNLMNMIERKLRNNSIDFCFYHEFNKIKEIVDEKKEISEILVGDGKNFTLDTYRNFLRKINADDKCFEELDSIMSSVFQRNVIYIDSDGHTVSLEYKKFWGSTLF